jgi:hypothetical protein
VHDLQHGIEAWGMWRSLGEIETAVRKSTRGSTMLSYTQFCELLLPHDR